MWAGGLLAATLSVSASLSARDDDAGWVWNGTIDIQRSYRYGPKVSGMTTCQIVQEHSDGEVTIKLVDDPLMDGIVSATGQFRGTLDVKDRSPPPPECKGWSPPCKGVGNHQTASGSGEMKLSIDPPSPYDDGSYLFSVMVEEPMTGRKDSLIVAAGKCKVENIATEVYPIAAGVPLIKGTVDPAQPNVFAGRQTESGGDTTWTVTWDLTRSRPSAYEVVIIPQEAYRTWLPEAGQDEETPGNSLAFRAELRLKAKPDKEPDQKARFRWELVDVSREPGINLNTPVKDKAGKGLDLRIPAGHDADLEVAEDGQHARTRELKYSADVLIDAYDYGAWGKLRVSATLEDGEVVTGYLQGAPGTREVTLPRDENDNRVADAWEEQVGILGRNLPADWDGAELPAGQQAPGDGVPLYEKYRGFQIEGVHERLDPNWKHLFVHDPGGLIRGLERQAMALGVSLPTFDGVFGMRLRLLDAEEWTGPGSSTEDRRIVNFNHGWAHGFDQHALHLEAYNSHTRMPPDYEEALDRHGYRDGDAEKTFYGVAYADFTRKIGSPRHTFQVAVFLETIRDLLVLGDARTVLCHSNWDEYKRQGARGCWDVSDDISLKLEAHMARHPEQFREALLKTVAYVTFHELAHGVGVEHHVGRSDGDRESVMRYRDILGDCQLSADDPFLLRCYDPWPHRLCRTVENRYRAESCWKQVIVSDSADAFVRPLQ